VRQIDLVAWAPLRDLQLFSGTRWTSSYRVYQSKYSTPRCWSLGAIPLQWTTSVLIVFQSWSLSRVHVVVILCNGLLHCNTEPSCQYYS